LIIFFTSAAGAGVCLMTWCFPCVQYGYNAEKVGQGCCGACCGYYILAGLGRKRFLFIHACT